jgi:hypothetical protein
VLLVLVLVLLGLAPLVLIDLGLRALQTTVLALVLVLDIVPLCLPIFYAICEI